VTQFSAAPSALGYIFQCRYALLESLRRLRKEEEFTVSIETLDDVSFETEGGAAELLQTKHHLNRPANLTDASPDLWKSIRIWCEGMTNGTILDGSTFFLVTTAQTSEGSAAHYLKADDSRNVSKAIERLNATAESSTNETNKPAYAAFCSLDPDQKKALANATVVVVGVPSITDLNAELRKEIYGYAETKFLDPFMQRLEGWWFRRSIKNMAKSDPNPILSEELYAETTRLREQFKQDCLPIDDEIMDATMDATIHASGYQDTIFVQQLRMIEIGNPRVVFAIRNYFRAFEQRSRWIREDLLLVGELGRYEDRLVEEWDLRFQQMRDELGDETAEEAKKREAQTLYKWIETGMHHSIRPGVTELSIARGTYHMLADDQRVGWHPEFVQRLKNLLEPQEA